MVKGAVLMAIFLLANFWFMIVVDTNMNRGVTIGDALKQVDREKSE